MAALVLNIRHNIVTSHLHKEKEIETEKERQKEIETETENYALQKDSISFCH